MHSHADTGFLIPDMLNETSRFSTPRSSVGDGISSDCDADVESNMSGNSEETSPHRRRSSYGIYGIVPASRSQIFLQKMEESQTKKEAEEKMKSAVKDLLMKNKVLILPLIMIVLLLVFGILFLFSSCLGKCKQSGQHEGEHAIKSEWPMLFPYVVPQAEMLLYDVNHDNESDVVLALRRKTTSIGESLGNTSFIVAIDGKTGAIIRKMQIDFLPFVMHYDPIDRTNASCFAMANEGVVSRLSLTMVSVLWKIRPCTKIYSAIVIKDIDDDTVSDLLIACSWVSMTDETISGIALVSGLDGNLIGSKIRYQPGQMPYPFLMQHKNAKGETCVLFGIKRGGRSTVLAVRLKRLIEIATGTRSRVNLVSENPLVVAKNVRPDLKPAYDDISGDGVKDIGFVLQHGIISFIDGATLSLRKTIDARNGHIISISVLPGTNLKRPLLAVLKTRRTECKDSLLDIYDFRNGFDPYKIPLSNTPLLVAENNMNSRKQFIFWFSDEHKPCVGKTSNETLKEIDSKKHLSSSDGSSLLPQSSKLDDITDNLDIETIDKDVLDNLRQYVGIDDKGVTRHHKLFHLVCNYLLLRFLISYGISTESVMKDFRTTRSHLMHLSNKNLGKALTEQLKELLANDYDNGIENVPPWFDENNIDWLKDLDGKSGFKVRRDTYSFRQTNDNILYANQKAQLAALDESESSGKAVDSLGTMPESADIIPRNEGERQDDNFVSDLVLMANEGIPRETDDEKPQHGTTELNQLGIKEVETRKKIPCHLPIPDFKSLLIGKVVYKWANVAVSQDQGETEEEGDQVDKNKGNRCTNVSMTVLEMQVHDDYLYYTVVYHNGHSGSNVLTQINKVKLNSDQL